MKISKKIVSIGSITAITAPIVVAVSCGGQSTSTNVQIKKPEIKFYVKSDSGTPDKSGKTNYGTFRIHIPELGISYQGYNSVPFEAGNINASPVNSYVDGDYDHTRKVDLKYPTIIWNQNKNLNSTKGIGHDVEITITLKSGPGISSINGKKEVQYTYTVNKDKILNDMRAIEDFGILKKEEDKKSWISKARKAIEDRLNFKDPKSLKKGEHLYTFEGVTKIPEGFLYDMNANTATFKFLPGDINFSSVTEIGDVGFQTLKSLPENIDFSNVTKIGGGAFKNIEFLPENINFSSVTEIGIEAFRDITSLPENINFPNITRIGNRAFSDVLSIPEKIRFNNKITYEEFVKAFSISSIKSKAKKYDESWFNAHRNPAKTTTP